MSRFTRTVSVLGAGAMALALTACGGDDSSEYCDLITDTEEDFSSALSGDPTDPENSDVMQDLADRMNEIADAAPDDVQGDWEYAAEAFQAFTEIDPEDPASLEGMEQYADMDTRMQNISDQVSEECDIEFG
ncbi:hypothetical protein [Jiangella gansuensis]|uniref:hypothetical protein n=1 Tax=Jiangella gansuensis TaxID=281473 RepID=UPI0004BBE05B|nr:hypothetical protein [Jiangella gansuensis]